jgi:hypothetical protein
MGEKQCVQGRWIDAGDVQWLRGWIESHMQWSRKRIARELCLKWDWKDQRGRIKDFAARSFLLKLEGRGEICLPPLREAFRRTRRKPSQPEGWEEPPVWQASLKELRPLQIEVIQPASKAAGPWGFFISRYHYLGLHVVGENMGYLIKDREGRELSCLLFGAAAWRCAARDQWIGWSGEALTQGLQRIANNTRFLILPWVQVKGLASHILGKVAKRINRDWEAKYGHGLDWLETFVESRRFVGTCYKAANWQCVGESQGRSRQDRKHQLEVETKGVFLYRLRS